MSAQISPAGEESETLAAGPGGIAVYDYHLPGELIAQNPAVERDASRLMTIDRTGGIIGEQVFREIPALLRRGDCIVLNQTRVSPCRMAVLAGGRCGEILIVRASEISPVECSVDAMVHPGRAFKVGVRIESPAAAGAAAIVGRVESVTEAGRRLILASADGRTPIRELLVSAGSIPFPPYITNRTIDPNRYQTCFAVDEGSAAAPTAGLHFTPRLLGEIADAKIRIARLTLHVGPGTFRPVSEREIASGKLHEEPYWLGGEAAETIRQARAEGGRIIAVGTTVCRTLEWIADKYGEIRPDAGVTDLFIREGHSFRAVDALLTNFHFPRTSLLMLVSAFAGRDLALTAYGEAVAKKFRFYSFGDAMLIW